MTLDGLPPELAASLSACLAAGRRFYVAWHPDYRAGVLRHKDAKGLADWQARVWKIFDGKPPTIEDVSEAIPGLWIALLGDDARARQIVFQSPATLAVRHGPPAPDDSVIAVDTLFDELAGTFSPEAPSIWAQMKKEFEERASLVRPWVAWEDRREVRGGLEPGVWCWECGWYVAPGTGNPRSGDMTQADALQACAEHLVNTGHGDRGWVEVQEGGTSLRVLRVPVPEGAERPWEKAASSSLTIP